MSGFAFQKLNGAGTKMQELIDSVNKSDLYRMAKEFASNVNLVPITRSWEIGINENPQNDLALGGLYFGKWILNHNSQDRANNDNGKKRSQAFLKYGNDVVARTMVLISGNDIMAWETATTEHYGFGTSLHVYKLENDQQPQHGVQVSFIGYRISENPNFVFPATGSAQTDGNIHLSAQDLANAGYLYQWNVTTGSGTFVNANNPNAVFVPDGNGNYVLQLVVTSPDGVVSAPTDVPVTVDFDQKMTIFNNKDTPWNGNEGVTEFGIVPPFSSISVYGKNGSIGGPYAVLVTDKPNAKIKLTRTVEGEDSEVVFFSDVQTNHPFFSEPLKNVLLEITEVLRDDNIVFHNSLPNARLRYNACVTDIIDAGGYPVYFPRYITYGRDSGTGGYQLRDATLGVLYSTNTGLPYQSFEMVLPDGVTELFIESII